MSQLPTTIIYGLVDPRNDYLRYVGKTIQPLHARLRIHLNDAQKIKRRHVCAWIRSLQRLGVEPEIREIERVGDDWCEREQFWIAYFRSVGCDLTNETLGGEGVPGRKQTAETRAKMLGRVQSPEARLKISEAAKRQHSDPVTQARWLEAMQHLNVPQEVRDRKAQWNRDNGQRIRAIFINDPERLKRRGEAISAGKLKPEASAKAAESQRRRHTEKPFSAETRAKLSAAFKGRVFSEETRRRMSEAAKARCARQKAA